MATIWEAARETVAEIETVIRGLGYEPSTVVASTAIVRVSFDAGGYPYALQLAFSGWEAEAGYRRARKFGSLADAAAWLAQVIADGVLVEEDPEGGWWRAERLGHKRSDIYTAPTREAAIAAARAAS